MVRFLTLFIAVAVSFMTTVVRADDNTKVTSTSEYRFTYKTHGPKNYRWLVKAGVGFTNVQSYKYYDFPQVSWIKIQECLFAEYQYQIKNSPIFLGAKFGVLNINDAGWYDATNYLSPNYEREDKYVLAEENNFAFAIGPQIGYFKKLDEKKSLLPSFSIQYCKTMSEIESLDTCVLRWTLGADLWIKKFILGLDYVGYKYMGSVDCPINNGLMVNVGYKF